MRAAAAAEAASGIPRISGENADYCWKLADSGAEVEAALRLRWQVFRTEEGCLPDAVGGRDRDEYDAVYHHLLVLRRDSGAVAGTYRLGTRRDLPDGMPFYSQREFAIFGLEPFQDRVLEAGRACVAPAERSGGVVALLWQGIAALCRAWHCRYLLGCASLPSAGPEQGWGAWRRLPAAATAGCKISGRPQPGYELPEATADERAALPPLLKSYLHMGAKIGSVPALDRGFGSVDFLIWLDLNALPERYVRHFKVEKC